MKVFAFVKLRGERAGIISTFHPVDEPRSEEELKFFLPVLVDINIPCGEKFSKGLKCVNCEYNDPDLCDNIKYTRGIWGEGSLLTPPKPIAKRKYYINRKEFISTEKEQVIVKEEKTREERAQVLLDALSNEQPISVIKEVQINKVQKLKYG